MTWGSGMPRWLEMELMERSFHAGAEVQARGNRKEGRCACRHMAEHRTATCCSQIFTDGGPAGLGERRRTRREKVGLRDRFEPARVQP